MIESNGTNGIVLDGKQVRRIRFYDGMGVWLELEGVELKHSPEGREQEYRSDETLAKIETGEPRKARKVVWDEQDNFFVKHDGKYSFDSGVALYVYLPKYKAVVGEVVTGESETETRYAQTFKLPLVGWLESGERVDGIRIVGGERRFVRTEFGALVQRIEDQFKLLRIHCQDAKELVRLYGIKPLELEIKVEDDYGWSLDLSEDKAIRLLQEDWVGVQRTVGTRVLLYIRPDFKSRNAEGLKYRGKLEEAD